MTGFSSFQRHFCEKQLPEVGQVILLSKNAQFVMGISIQLKIDLVDNRMLIVVVTVPHVCERIFSFELRF